MERTTYRFDQVTINYDRKRIPLSGAEREKRQGVYPYYGAQGVIDHVNDYIFDGDFLLIAEDGENLKSKKQNIAQMASGRFWVNNHAHIVQGNHLCDTQYLCYLINTMDLSGFITGSAQPKLSQANMNMISVDLPDIEVQHRIVDFVRSFDEKITVNDRINDNLLQQARALFQHWVSDTPSILYNLSEAADINPETYSPKESWSFVNYLDTSSITSGRITDIQYIIPSEEKLPSRARRIIRENDVVFSTVRPNQLHYGIIPLPKPNMLGSTGFVVIRSKKDSIPNEIIYLAITEPTFVEQMQQLAEQSVSTFPSIRPNDLDACIIPQPREEDADFVSLVKSIFRQLPKTTKRTKDYQRYAIHSFLA